MTEVTLTACSLCKKVAWTSANCSRCLDDACNECLRIPIDVYQGDNKLYCEKCIAKLSELSMQEERYNLCFCCHEKINHRTTCVICKNDFCSRHCRDIMLFDSMSPVCAPCVVVFKSAFENTCSCGRVCRPSDGIVVSDHIKVFKCHICAISDEWDMLKEVYPNGKLNLAIKCPCGINHTYERRSFARCEFNPLYKSCGKFHWDNIRALREYLVQTNFTSEKKRKMMVDDK